MEASGGHSPTVDASTTLTIEPGVIFKIGHTLPAINVNGALIASAAANNQIIFTSLKDDLRGGDTNGDSAASTPHNEDWSNITFASGSTGNFVNAIFGYAGFGFIPHNLPPTNTLAKDFPTITIGHNLMGTMSSDWTSTSGNAFNKIIIHNFATVNPQNFNYKIGIKNSQNNFIAAIELPNLQNISDTELTATVQGQFSIGERYYATVETIQPTGTSAGVADSFSVGQDAAGRLAVAFYEMVPGAPANPALSIDAGALVVVQ